jgi:hypothetical protein
MDKVKSFLNPEWIPFSVSKIKGAKLVWRHPSHSESAYSRQENEDFLTDNAYAIAATPAFKNVEFDHMHTRQLIAERYGGGGIGTNGGGGRCGNTDDYQLKGIGANCLVGETTDKLHSYGGLDVPAAMLEIINSYVFGKVLPLGTVKVQGLIFVGEDAGIDIGRDRTCWGAIMVRDKALRPAHLMRVVSFKPRPSFEFAHTNDIARMRRMYRKLAASFAKHNEFIVMLGGFLRNQANQFGFARAARILNGVITESNCTLDGRWIDLNACSFIDGGVNYSTKSQFYTEHELPLTYAIELLHNYSKYNGINLSPEPLVKYYREQFSAYFSHHIGFALGFNTAQVPQDKSPAWQVVAGAFTRVIHAGKSAVTTRAKVNLQDPVIALIRGLYLSLAAAPSTAQAYRLAGITDKREQDGLSENFAITMKDMYADADAPQISFAHFVAMCLISAMKRSYLSAIYYLPLLGKSTSEFCYASTPDNIWGFIDSYCKAADWIYEHQTPTVDIFKTPTLTVSLTLFPYQYTTIDALEQTNIFLNFDSLNNFLQSNYKSQLWIGGYDLFQYIDGLHCVLPILESENKLLAKMETP